MFVYKVDVEKSLLDELPNRETDVLVLLCDRLYDKEIADLLTISPATVKTHLTRIYNKLPHHPLSAVLRNCNDDEKQED